MDERAVSHALLAPERSVKRYRIAFEGEQIFQREVDLIDVTGSDVVLDLVECVAVLLARPRQPEVGNLGAIGGAMRLEPAAGARVIERLGRAKQPDPEQRNATVRGQKPAQLWFEAIAELIGEEARGVKPAGKPRRNRIERDVHFIRRARRDNLLWLGIEEAPAAWRQTVVEEHVGRRGHLFLPTPLAPAA